jgi:transcription elongation factor S-II
MADPKDLLRHVRVALDAASQVDVDDDSSANVLRCCDVLKLLQTTPVTADLLAGTKAGKAMRKLSTHSNAKIKANAARVVAIWKSSISKQLSKAAPPTATARAPPPAPTPTPDPASSSSAVRRDPTHLVRQSSDSVVDQTPRAAFARAPAAGDAARDSIRAGLAQALLLAVIDECEDVDSPYVLAAAIEDSVFLRYADAASNGYKAKVRTLLFNLKDKKNPDLRRRVLLGEISPSALLDMTSEELASDAQREQNDKIRAMMKRETERTQTVTGNVTDMFRCGKCKKRRCTYYQMQTRSADEPMTTFVHCVECHHRWKFC